MADNIDPALLAEIEEIFAGQPDPGELYADDGLAAEDAVLYALTMHIARTADELEEAESGLVYGVLSPAAGESSGITSGESKQSNDSDNDSGNGNGNGGIGSVTSYAIVELGRIEGSVTSALWGQRFSTDIIAAAVLRREDIGYGVHLATRSGREAAVVGHSSGALHPIADPRGTDTGAMLARCLGADASDGLPAWTPAMAAGSWAASRVLDTLSECDDSEDLACAIGVHALVHTLRQLAFDIDGDEDASGERTEEILGEGAAGVRSELERLARRFNASGFAGSARAGILPDSFGGSAGVAWCGEATVGALLARHARAINPQSWALGSSAHPEASSLIVGMLAACSLLWAGYRSDMG